VFLNACIVDKRLPDVRHLVGNGMCVALVVAVFKFYFGVRGGLPFELVGAAPWKI